MNKNKFNFWKEKLNVEDVILQGVFFLIIVYMETKICVYILDLTETTKILKDQKLSYLEMKSFAKLERHKLS